MKGELLSEILEESRAGFWGSNPGSGDVDVRVVRNGDIQEDGVRWSALPLRSVSRSEAERAAIRKGDILITTSGECGYTAYVASEPAQPTIASNFIRILRFYSARVVSRYVFHFLHSRAFRSSLAPYIRGTTLKNLSLPMAAERIEVPLLSLDAQRRIAEILDKADALRAKRRAALAQLDALTQSIFLDMFGDPATNPMGWPKVTLDELFEIARGGSPRPIDAYITDSPDGINWIMIGDASEGAKYITVTKKRIRPEGAKRSRAVKPGDFLLTNSMSFGRPYIMRTSGCIHDGWLVLSPRQGNVDPDYFYSLLGSRAVFTEFARRAPGATVKNLNIDLVRGVAVPVAPLARQKEFAKVVAAIEQSSVPFKQALAEFDALFSSLQQRAFRGEL